MPPDDTVISPDNITITVDNLAKIESIVIDYALVDIKGNLTLHFAEYILLDEDETRRSLSTATAEDDVLILEL